MTDIVERLGVAAYPTTIVRNGDLMEEAAAEIERLRGEVEAGLAVARAVNRVLSPQRDRTFDMLIEQSQWAVDTCRAYIARSERK